MSQIEWNITDNALNVRLSGDFIRFGDTSALYAAAEDVAVRRVEIRAEELGRWDSSLLLILFEFSRITKARRIGLVTRNLPDGLEKMWRLSLAVPAVLPMRRHSQEDFLTRLGGRGLEIYQSFRRGWAFLCQNIQALGRCVFGKTATREVDFLFALEECGPQAVGIVSLISFMVGLILAFVGAIQLKTFGAQIYVASLVTIGMIRIMGAIMCGIIMAGRTGASFAATLGTMQVNEEIDALKTMGIPISEFLVAPRMGALVLVMPFLTMWADLTGILGGAFVGVMFLGIPAAEYLKYAVQAWTIGNFWVGIFHGFVFGFIISLCGCYYGIESGRNADGVGTATTKAVVSAIIWMILATGLITLIFERLGI